VGAIAGLKKEVPRSIGGLKQSVRKLNFSFTIQFSDRGTPDGYRHMDGFSCHTFSTHNANGERFWAQWHFKTQQASGT